MNFISRLYKFMYGRYGIDDLYRFLIIIYFIIAVINIFVNSRVLSVIGLIIFIFVIYRAFSKNIYKRKKENDRYLKIKRRFISRFESFRKKYHDRDYVIYRKCHHCKTILKLPLPDSRGIKKVKCPKCKKRNRFLIFKKQKIEIIKNKKKEV